MKLYQGCVQYAAISSVMFGDYSLDKTSKRMQEAINYYKGIGENIREATIEAICDKCYNTGEIHIHKGIITKIKKCDCKLEYANEKILVNIN
jgi:uncharacterized protein with ATP-grasp and redox domains